MNIRESKNNDIDSIRAVHEDAFGSGEGKRVAQLACAILSDESAKPLVSLVAEEDGKIVGNVIFSTVNINGSEGVSVYILAPLAVASDYQKNGLGKNLIKSGLDELINLGADIILVLGDPNYYKHAGFKSEHNIIAPYELAYPQAWMALELKAGVLATVKGVAQCARSLSSPEYW